MIDPIQVGSKIANLRKDLSLTQDELANRLSVTRQALSKWETGISLPSVELIVTLCQLFDVTFEELLCLYDSTVIEDVTDLFKTASRTVIVNQVCKGVLPLNIPDVLYQFSPSERLQILKSIKDKKVSCDLNELAVKLTTSEYKYVFDRLPKRRY